MTTIELKPAYVWDCESCGRENFQRSISRRLDPTDPGDADVIRTIHDLDPAEPISDLISVSCQTRPDRVTCRHCGTEFLAADDSVSLDDDE